MGKRGACSSILSAIYLLPPSLNLHSEGGNGQYVTAECLTLVVVKRVLGALKDFQRLGRGLLDIMVAHPFVRPTPLTLIPFASCYNSYTLAQLSAVGKKEELQ